MSIRIFRLKLFWGSLASGAFLLLLTFYWLGLPYTFGDEAFLIKWTSLVKKELLGFDPKPSPEEVLFIDISANKTTIAGEDLFGPSEYNKKIITDRAQLGALLELMAASGSDIRMVFVDVLFEDDTPEDSLLAARIADFGDKILGVSHLRDGSELICPSVDIPYAVSTYRASQGIFLKYPLLIQDTLKTVPLVLLEKLNGARFGKWAGVYWIDGKLSLPTPLVDFKVRPSDFKTGSSMAESNFTVYDLGTIMKSHELLGPEATSEYFKDRIIMIGDFVHDQHNTPFDEMAGVLIIYNTYLSLLAGGNIVSIYWVLFLLLGYTLISYRVLSKKKVRKPRWLARIFQSKPGLFILNTLDEALILTLMTIGSYFLFGIHINILILLIVIKIGESTWKFSKSRLKATARRSTPE